MHPLFLIKFSLINAITTKKVTMTNTKKRKQSIKVQHQNKDCKVKKMTPLIQGYDANGSPIDEYPKKFYKH